MSADDVSVGSGSNLERGLGGMGHTPSEEREAILTRARAVVRGFKSAPLKLELPDTMTRKIELRRPRGPRQLAEALVACLPHLPWASAEEAEAALLAPDDAFWTQVSLLLVSDGALVGVTALSPVVGHLGVSFLGVLPDCRINEITTPWVAQLVAAYEESERITHAAYDAFLRPAFEAAGFVTTLTRQRVTIPMDIGEVPAAVPIQRMTRAEVTEFLRRSKSTLDCSLDQVCLEGCYAALPDGQFAGAIIVADGPGRKWMTLEHIWFDSKLRGSGGASIVSRASLNEVVRRGTTLLIAWEDVSNTTVQLLNKRWNATRDEPLHHMGWKIS